MQKWEYLRLAWNSWEDDDNEGNYMQGFTYLSSSRPEYQPELEYNKQGQVIDSEAVNFDKLLDIVGSDGWELIGFHEADWIFKRPKEI
ncbi:MAG: hypothetical protein WCS37_19470 [Chloroflexota bacterium]|nr:hypothetical protein [Chloroflexota bacterium]